MSKRLTLAEQRKLIRALPAHRISACKAHCRQCQMRGEGIQDILKSIKSVLGPVAKEIAPTILKELLLPMIKKKAGLGLNPAGGSLKLAGQGKKKKKK